MFLTEYSGSSFFDLVRQKEGVLNPSIFTDLKQSGIPHGTTILAIKYNKGVLIAGDRRATEGHNIANRRINKVYKTDDYSAIAIAGAAGPCIEMAKIMTVELEHYEKIEGMELTLEGKANKLSHMIRANLPMAMQGLIVIPIFVGYDKSQKEGRIFKYDVTGGRYEEVAFYATGSGGKDANGSIKKSYRSNLNLDETAAIALEALYDAADEDAGTGGPDMLRNIFPNVVSIDADGAHDKEEGEIREFYVNMIERKKQ